MVVGLLAAVLAQPNPPFLVEVGTLRSLDRETLAPKLRSLEIIVDPRHSKLAVANLAELLPAATLDRDPEFLVYAPVTDRDRAVERRWKERIERAITQANPYGDLTRIEEWRLAIDSVPPGDEYAVTDVLGRLFAWRHLGSVIAGADLRPGKRTWTASHAALPGDADLVIREETRTLWREATRHSVQSLPCPGLASWPCKVISRATARRSGGRVSPTKTSWTSAPLKNSRRSSGS